MGQAKLKKGRAPESSAVVTRRLRALKIAEELIRHPNMRPTFSSFSLGSDPDDPEQLDKMLNDKDSAATMRRSIVNELATISSESWVGGMAESFSRAGVRVFIEAIIAKAQPVVVGRRVVVQDEEGNSVVTDDPIYPAIQAVIDRLSADPDDPRWMALALFKLAKLIGSNASRHYRHHEWDTGSLLFMTIERALLRGDGLAFGKDLEKLIKGSPPDIVAQIAGGMVDAIKDAAVFCGYTNQFFEPKQILH